MVKDVSNSSKKSVRKNLLLDTERAKLFDFMERNGIWYMPLKGIMLKDMYPKMGLRQMADNDILFDGDCRQSVHDWFTEQGYEIKLYHKGNHDVYLKEPIYNFEMHLSLYGEHHKPEWYEYYKDVKARLLKDKDNCYGYHFSAEDYYIYFLTHGYKHYDGGGTGFPFLLDLFVYLKHKQNVMDFSYIEKELETLELTVFEHSCRELATKIFGDVNCFDYEQSSPHHKEMLIRFFTSGTYGTIEQSVQKNIGKIGKSKYILHRIFTGVDILAEYHPIFKNKLLMPIGWMHRVVIIMTSRFGNAFKELRVIIKAKRG